MTLTQEQQTLNDIRQAIDQLSLADVEAIAELAEFIRMNVKRAGPIVGGMAVALVGAEMAAQ